MTRTRLATRGCKNVAMMLAALVIAGGLRADEAATAKPETSAPAVVGITMEGRCVTGVLSNNQWSFASSGPQNINGMFVQPFINYNLNRGWYLTTAPIISPDCNAAVRGVWTVPLGCCVGRVFL